MQRTFRLSIYLSFNNPVLLLLSLKTFAQILANLHNTKSQCVCSFHQVQWQCTQLKKITTISHWDLYHVPVQRVDNGLRWWQHFHFAHYRSVSCGCSNTDLSSVQDSVSSRHDLRATVCRQVNLAVSYDVIPQLCSDRGQDHTPSQPSSLDTRPESTRLLGSMYILHLSPNRWHLFLL